MGHLRGEGAFFTHYQDPDAFEWGKQFTTDDGRPIPVEYRGAWAYMPNPARLGVSQGAEGVLKRVNSVIPQMKGMAGCRS